MRHARLTSILTSFLFFSALPFSTASSLDGVCNTVKKLGDGKGSLNFPTASLKYCNQEFFRCKTRIGGRVPCGTKCKTQGIHSGCSVKYCDAWTCIPGSVGTTIRVPCGIKVGSTPVKYIDLARQAIPNADQLVKTSVGYCKCLPKVFDLVNLDTVKKAVSSGDTGVATAEILQKYGEAQQCMIDNGFNIQNNKAGLNISGGALVQTDTIKVFTAAEIDMARYISLATALATCVTTCNVQVIEGWFQKYLSDSEALLGKQIKAFLRPWEKAFDEIIGSFETIGNATGEIGKQFDTIQHSVANITDNFCKNVTACAETTVVKLKIKVESTIKTSEAFISLKTELTTAIKNARDLYKIVNDAIAAFDVLSDLSLGAILEKVVTGKIKSIEQVAETLQSAKRLPVIVSQLQNTLPHVQKYAKQLQNTAPDFVSNIEGILEESWLVDARASRVAEQGAEKAVREIQDIFRNKVVAPVTSISKNVEKLTTSLQNMIQPGHVTVHVPAVASYQRWSAGHFAMPRLTTGRTTISLGGFKESIQYPKFYRDEQYYRIPFPNHHIPYIKIVIAKGAIPKRSIGNSTAGNITSAQDFGLVMIPTPTTNYEALPYFTEAPSNGTGVPLMTLEGLATEMTALTLSSAISSFSIPSSLYTNPTQVPEPMTTPSSVIFVVSTDDNGSVATEKATLADSDAFVPTATETRTSFSTTIPGLPVYTAMIESESPSRSQNITSSSILTNSTTTALSVTAPVHRPSNDLLSSTATLTASAKAEETHMGSIIYSMLYGNVE
ncbi:hypothetical protein B0J14DRAFT_566335 [Halenospora varia]|nr:hypothetical protein B0J14DRAFT_566335 [Halenospora varia]